MEVKCVVPVRKGYEIRGRLYHPTQHRGVLNLKLVRWRNGRR